MTVHHKNLQVSVDASLDDIKKAYKKLAKIYHPDISKDDGSKFKQLNISYQFLLYNFEKDQKQKPKSEQSKPDEKVNKYYHFYVKNKNTVMLSSVNGVTDTISVLFVLKQGVEYKITIPKGTSLPKKIIVNGVSVGDQDYIHLIEYESDKL